jgi:hypothetical protein
LRNRASLSRPFRRDETRAASQTSSLAAARSTPCKNKLEIESQLEFADHYDRGLVALQRHQIAAADLAFDHKAEPFKEGLDRPIKGRLQNRSPWLSARFVARRCADAYTQSLCHQDF